MITAEVAAPSMQAELSAAVRQRQTAFEHSQATFDALYRSESRWLSRAERLAVAHRSAEVQRSDAVADRFRHYLAEEGASPVACRPVLLAHAELLSCRPAQ